MVTENRIKKMMNNPTNIMYLELKKDLTIKGDILAPEIHISEHCKSLNLLLKGVFTIPAKYYNEPDKHVIIALYLLGSLFSDLPGDVKYIHLQLLESIVRDNYELTLEIYKNMFVVSTIFKPNLSIEYLLIIKNFYDNTTLWLNAWHKKLNTYDLKNSSINWLEKTAFTKVKRYDLIRELHSNNFLSESFAGHNSSWLIAETSILLSAINNDTPNINQMYLGYKAHIDNLNDFSKIPDQYETDDLMSNFSIYIDTIARNKAETHNYFDTNYFKPYLAACRSENAYTQKGKLELIPITKPKQSKRGRKMGQKRKKY